MSKTTLIAEPGKQELTLMRVFDAPPERLFEVMTDPKAIPEWWGPRDLATTVEEMDPRRGGTWRFIQRDAGGNEFGFRGVYHDVTPAERVVQTFEFEGMPGHVLLETMTFEPHEGGTKVVTTSVFQSLEDRDGMLQSGMEDGARETWDRLAEIVEQG
jgi:uncharacterized protein YndB with AHSA1/START domain